MFEPMITPRHAFLKLMELLAIAAEAGGVDLDESVLPIGDKEYTVIDLGEIVLAGLPRPYDFKRELFHDN